VFAPAVLLNISRNARQRITVGPVARRVWPERIPVR
jgi:hypothetical protein